MIQSLLGPMEPFEKVIDPAPAVGAKVGVPQPVVVAFRGHAITIAPGDVGRVSVNWTPEIVALFGLCNVIVKLEIPPALVGFGLKLFAIVIEDGSMMFARR